MVVVVYVGSMEAAAVVAAHGCLLFSHLLSPCQALRTRQDMRCKPCRAATATIVRVAGSIDHCSFALETRF